MPPETPVLGTRWRFGRYGATYEIVEKKAAKEGYICAKVVGHRGTISSIPGTEVELRLAAFGSIYQKREMEKA